MDNEEKYRWQCQTGEISKDHYRKVKEFQESATIFFDQLLLMKSKAYGERGQYFPVSPMSSK